MPEKQTIPNNRISTIAKSMVGSVFEWYQFSIFGYFAPVIGKVFFPEGTTESHLLLAYVIFFAGYLARPIGGIMFGIIGDRYGRKQVIVWTLLLMAIPSVLMGILPGYASIGIAAPTLLMGLRVLQGLSMGGNYGGSLTFMSEQSARGRRGLTSSFVAISILVGLLLGSITVAFFNVLFTQEFIETWGFRLPFLLGIGVGIWGLWMKNTLPESPVFEDAERSGKIVANPLNILFKDHRRSLALLVGVVILHDLSFYIMFVFLVTYFTETFNFSKDLMFTINSVNLVIVAVSVFVSAWWSDKIGRKPIMFGAALFFAVATIPLLSLVTADAHWFTVFACQSILAIAVGVFLGPLPAFMVETFPSSIRSSAITTTTNTCGPIFGGSAPLVLTYLTKLTGLTIIPALYLTLAALVAMFALRKLQAPYNED